MPQRDSRTCNSFEALRLFCLLVFVGQCFCKIRWTVIRIPGTFPSQDISCSLSDCVRPFSESIFLNALFWIFFCLHALCDVTEGLCLCVFRLTGHYPPHTSSPQPGHGHILSVLLTAALFMPLSKHVQSPTTVLNRNKRRHIVADCVSLQKDKRTTLRIW